VRELLSRAAILGVATMAVAGMLSAQADPCVGTWVLNVAKSKYSPGPPPSKEVRVYGVSGSHVSVSVDSTDSQGKLVSLRYTAVEDGKDYPLTGLAAADAIAMKRIDPLTFEADTKKSGKVIGTTMGQISKDGKSLMLTFKSTGANGQAITNVAVYEKQ
jgi:hypothetical protein